MIERKRTNITRYHMNSNYSVFLTMSILVMMSTIHGASIMSCRQQLEGGPGFPCDDTGTCVQGYQCFKSWCVTNDKARLKSPPGHACGGAIQCITGWKCEYGYCVLVGIE